MVGVDQVTGEERHETYRNLWRAAQHIRAVNTDRRVRARWAWA
ncbi:hypothetical protein [Phycicoccus sp. SLBN-51]|nr:hypothetical protein [Phycicoccus sp. SLBN-51]